MAKLLFYSLKIEPLKKDLNLEIDQQNPNIIQKENRPFHTIKISQNYAALIPLRTHLTHKYGYSIRSKAKNNGGLDYSKAYLVNTDKVYHYYNEQIKILNYEYLKITKNQETIAEEFKLFLLDFYSRITNYHCLNKSQQILIDFSALQYQIEMLSKCVDEIKKSEKNS